VWRADATVQAGPSPWPILMVNAVAAPRSLPRAQRAAASVELREPSRTLERYGASAIPEGSTIADWPLSYEDLEPAYAAVERAIGVAGAATSLFEGPRSSP